MPRELEGATARQVILHEYGSDPNFMTPEVLEYGWADKNVAYELSTGEGIRKGRRIYGVSLVRRVGNHTERLVTESQCFHSKAAARVFINQYRDKVEVEIRHGSPADRGSADRYYGRPRRPHYFEGDTYASEEVTEENMTPDEVAAYNKAYDSETDRKDWGDDHDYTGDEGHALEEV